MWKEGHLLQIQVDFTSQTRRSVVPRTGAHDSQRRLSCTPHKLRARFFDGLSSFWLETRRVSRRGTLTHSTRASKTLESCVLSPGRSHQACASICLRGTLTHSIRAPKTLGSCVRSPGRSHQACAGPWWHAWHAARMSTHEQRSEHVASFEFRELTPFRSSFATPPRLQSNCCEERSQLYM